MLGPARSGPNVSSLPGGLCRTRFSIGRAVSTIIRKRPCELADRFLVAFVLDVAEVPRQLEHHLLAMGVAVRRVGAPRGLQPFIEEADRNLEHAGNLV